MSRSQFLFLNVKFHKTFNMHISKYKYPSIEISKKYDPVRGDLSQAMPCYYYVLSSSGDLGDYDLYFPL